MDKRISKRFKILVALGGIIFFVLLLVIVLNFVKKSADTSSIFAGDENLSSSENEVLPIKEVEEDVKENSIKKVVFMISYLSSKCPSPYLYIYNDNTYELYDSLSKDKPPVPQSGEFSYDIVKIIRTIHDYELQAENNFFVKYKDKEYSTSSTNKELREFLDLIDVNLETCIKDND